MMNEELKYERGQIYYLRFDDAYGKELSVGRPAVIVSNQGHVDKSDTVVVALMSNTVRHSSFCAVRVILHGKQTYIHCTQIRVVDKGRMTDFVCKLDAADMRRVDNALALSLQLNGLVDKAKENENDNDDENMVLRMEMELYRKMYNKAMNELVEVRFKYDELKMGKRVKPVHVLPEANSGVESAAVKKEEPKPEMSNEEIENILIGAGINVTPKKAGNPESFKGRAKLAKGAKPVNVNTGTVEDFMSIGMTERRSKDVVRYRKKHGRFPSVQDLLNVPGFGNGCMAVFGPMLMV